MTEDCKELTIDEVNEYESVAETMAKRGLKGEINDVLPLLIRDQVVMEILSDPEAFQQRVRVYAYGLAMEKIHKRNEEQS
jgi:hypothetical protein